MYDMICLCITSLGFVAAAVRAAKRKKRILAVSSLAASACSVNFWRNPTEGMRRAADITCARLCFGLYLIEAWRTRKLSKPLPATMLCGTILCYKCAEKFHPKRYWFVFHALFHTSALMGKMMVLK